MPRRLVHYPEHPEARYIVQSGEIFRNLDADQGRHTGVIACFLWSREAANAAQQRFNPRQAPTHRTSAATRADQRKEPHA